MNIINTNFYVSQDNAAGKKLSDTSLTVAFTKISQMQINNEYSAVLLVQNNYFDGDKLSELSVTDLETDITLTISPTSTKIQQLQSKTLIFGIFKPFSLSKQLLLSASCAKISVIGQALYVHKCKTENCQCLIKANSIYCQQHFSQFMSKNALISNEYSSALQMHSIQQQPRVNKCILQLKNNDPLRDHQKQTDQIIKNYQQEFLQRRDERLKLENQNQKQVKNKLELIDQNADIQDKTYQNNTNDLNNQIKIEKSNTKTNFQTKIEAFFCSTCNLYSLIFNDNCRQQNHMQRMCYLKLHKINCKNCSFEMTSVSKRIFSIQCPQCGKTNFQMIQ